jgi:hypothetical protein
MSLITGTGMELLYANIAVGTALATFTTEAVLNDTTGMGVQARLPADFWLPSRTSVGRGIKIVARGILSSTTTGPTYLINIRLGGSQSITGPIILGMATSNTVAASMTNMNWELEGDVIMVTPGAAGAANSTVCGVGMFVTAANGASSPPVPGRVCYGGAATPGTVNVQTDTSQYINVTCTCGTSNASNSVRLQQLLVFGLN